MKFSKGAASSPGSPSGACAKSATASASSATRWCARRLSFEFAMVRVEILEDLGLLEILIVLPWMMTDGGFCPMDFLESVLFLELPCKI